MRVGLAGKDLLARHKGRQFVTCSRCGTKWQSSSIPTSVSASSSWPRSFTCGRSTLPRTVLPPKESEPRPALRIRSSAESRCSARPLARHRNGSSPTYSPLSTSITVSTATHQLGASFTYTERPFRLRFASRCESWASRRHANSLRALQRRLVRRVLANKALQLTGRPPVSVRGERPRCGRNRRPRNGGRTAEVSW